MDGIANGLSGKCPCKAPCLAVGRSSDGSADRRPGRYEPKDIVVVVAVAAEFLVRTV